MLLERLRLPFCAINPEFEESGPESHQTPEEMVLFNALGKAQSLSANHPGSLIIGSDQIGFCGGEVLLKPRTREKAVAQLLGLSGQEHQLLTALAIVRTAPDGTAPGTRINQRDLPGHKTVLVTSQLKVRQLNRSEVETYVHLDNPVNCAGSYKFESLGISLFESIEGDDPTAIIGLPLIALTSLLEAYGFGPLSRPDIQGETESL